MFWKFVPYLIEKNHVFNSACLFKDLNPRRHAPLSVTDYENWNLKL